MANLLAESYFPQLQGCMVTVNYQFNSWTASVHAFFANNLESAVTSTRNSLLNSAMKGPLKLSETYRYTGRQSETTTD